MSYRVRTIVLSVSVVALFASLSMAGEADHANVGNDHVGIKGYDPVAYFDGAPAKGDEKITAEQNGVVYRFSSESNKQKFVADPAHFCPAYGGWCATAFAQDHGKVDIDPTSFKVTDGRLYLFYKGIWGDARGAWVKDEPGNKVKADQNWKKTVGE